MFFGTNSSQKIKMDVKAHGASERLLGCKVIHEIIKSLKKFDRGKRLKKANWSRFLYLQSKRQSILQNLSDAVWMSCLQMYSRTALKRETRLTFLVTLAKLKSFIELRHSRISQIMTPQIWPTQESVSVHLICNTVLSFGALQNLCLCTLLRTRTADH
jgi:hypothetical protein